MTVWPSNAPGVPATVTSVDQDADVALLSLEADAPAGIFTPTIRWPRIGEATYSMAFGIDRNLPRQPHFTSGVITGMSNSPDRPMIVIDTQLKPGSSGAPVIDSDGVLLGIVVGRLATAPNRAIAAPAILLTRYLAGARLGDVPLDTPGSSPHDRLAAMSVLVQCTR